MEDNGLTFFMQGNRWRAVEKAFVVTANTKIAFDFMSTVQGEIHGIGLDEDNSHSNDRRIFKIFGTQAWAGALSSGASYLPGDLGKWKSFVIPVGQFYTGTKMRLILVNDDDSGSGAGTSRFRNVRVLYQ